MHGEEQVAATGQQGHRTQGSGSLGRLPQEAAATPLQPFLLDKGGDGRSVGLVGKGGQTKKPAQMEAY
jgi:hypothetical protein